MRGAEITYQRLFNKTPNIQIIHAGTECGLLETLSGWTWFLLGLPLRTSLSPD